jgi:hypothetical protein
VLVSTRGLAGTRRMHDTIDCSHFQVLMSIASSTMRSNSYIHAPILILEIDLRNDLNAKDTSA